MTGIEGAIETVMADLPFESWERLTGESSAAFAAFCAYRDFGLQRNIRKAVDTTEQDEAKRPKRYRVWRNWSTQFRWRQRAEEYDRYTEKLKQAERRKTIEAQGEVHRSITGKMLQVVGKKLDLMNPDDLTQGNLNEWVQTAIKAEQEMAGIVAPYGKVQMKQGELTFASEFEGL